MKQACTNQSFSLLIFFAVSFLIVSCEGQRPKSVEIKGVYGNPKPYWDKGINLADLGVNSIFVHSGSINDDMIERAKSEGIKVYAEFASLNGKNYVNDHPEAWPINELGEKVEAASWFMGVCPTDPGFRAYRFTQLKDLITKYELDGVWMDYVHWHAQFEEPEPILPETCFCNHCIDEFALTTETEIPMGSTTEKADWILNNTEDAWRKWRCQVIYDWTAEFRKIIKDHNPEMLLGLYHCPWNNKEFESARIRILGLDYNLLRETIDVFSPMVYHGRMGRAATWVADNITWFCDELDIKSGSSPKVWPIVQAYDDPEVISGEEFEVVLRGGLASASTGVMMFTTRAMAQSVEKTNVMKRVYSELKSANEN